MNYWVFGICWTTKYIIETKYMIQSGILPWFSTMSWKNYFFDSSEHMEELRYTFETRTTNFRCVCHQNKSYRVSSRTSLTSKLRFSGRFPSSHEVRAQSLPERSLHIGDYAVESGWESCLSKSERKWESDLSEG